VIREHAIVDLRAKGVTLRLFQSGTISRRCAAENRRVRFRARH
jgi:hypothetical protein